MILETKLKVGDQARISLDVGELFHIISPGLEGSFYPECTQIHLSHHVFENGAVGLVVSFDPVPFVIPGEKSIIVMPSWAVKGDLFPIDGKMAIALGKLTVIEGDAVVGEFREAPYYEDS